MDWRSWSDGLWQTASAGGLQPEASGEPQTTEPDAPVVVITNAPPSNVETYAPPSGMPSDFFDGMDLAAYFSLIGYDPAAIEEMNANGSYRSEHDAYQANGGLQSQAEEAWRRSGMWARGDGWNDLNRELFFNNYMDRAYGIDPEAGTSLNDPRLAKLAAEAFNKAAKDGDQQGVEALRILLKQSGFDVRLVFVGEHFDPNLSDDIDAYHQKMKFVVTPTGSSGPYQTGGMDGFQDVGWPQSNRTPTGQSAIPLGAGAKSAPEAMAIAKRIASEELARTKALTLDYQLGGHNDLYDAERHARWVYRMSIEVGSGWAGLFATAHELEGSAQGQPAIEAEMDRINNAIGMNAAINGTGMPTRSTPGLTYIKDGRLAKNGP